MKIANEIFRARWSLQSLAILVLTIVALASPAAAQIPSGAGEYQFSAWDGPDLRIHTYRPESATADTPIMIVMHGVNRDADRYRDDWIAVAESAGYIVAAPEFDAKRFPKAARYNLGGFGKGYGSGPVSAFDAIEPLFDDLRLRFGSSRQKYYLYGHSAGSQFVHRFLFAKPEARIETAFAANAGWYTMPQASLAFPYGLKNSGLPANAGRQAFRAPLVILLGDEDVEADDNLRQTPEAQAQGANRLIRGMIFFGTAATLAQRRGNAFCWRLRIVPGSGHKNSKMAWGVPAIVDSIAGPGLQSDDAAARSAACDAR